MKTESNFIDYGIYVDRKRSFIISLDHNANETLIETQGESNDEPMGGNTSVHQQNSDNEQVKKYCEAIIEQIVNAHNILVFGPSMTKFELQKHIRENKSLKHISEEILVTDSMERDAAVAFVKKHYSPATATQQ